MGFRWEEETCRAKLRPGAACRLFHYFFRDFAASDCIRPFILGAAAIDLGFSFFGFFFSRLPRCSPLAMALSSSPERAFDETTTAGGKAGGGAKFLSEEKNTDRSDIE